MLIGKRISICFFMAFSLNQLQNMQVKLQSMQNELAIFAENCKIVNRYLLRLPMKHFLINLMHKQENKIRGEKGKRLFSIRENESKLPENYGKKIFRICL